MKRVWLAVVATLLAAPAVGQSMKIGVVDLQRALNESDAGKKAREEFKVDVDKLQASLKRQKDDIEELKEQIEKKASVMKESERETLGEDYRKKLRDFERAYKDSQADLQKRDADLTASLIAELQEIIVDYGQRESYTLLLESNSSGVLYGGKEIDVTEAIIEEYNRKGSKRSKK
jgi:outer membrane protein